MTTITVSNSAQLQDALAQAKGGEVIKLATGNYGDLRLDDMTFASNITITSARPLHPATFTGLDLNNVSNLTMGSVVFDYKFAAGDPSYITPFSVTGGANVTIRNSTFNGASAHGVSAEADGYGYGTGLAISDTRNVHVSGNEIFNFYRGLSVSDSSAVTIAGNDVHGIRSDGMDFVQVQGVTIAGNHIHDFRISPGDIERPLDERTSAEQAAVLADQPLRARARDHNGK